MKKPESVEDTMSGIGILSVLDVARALGGEPLTASPERVANWLLNEYLKVQRGGFNYNPAINATYELFRGASTYEEAIRYCSTKGNPKGRPQNADAIKQVAPYALGNISNCYRIGFVAVPVGRVRRQTIYISIKAPMIHVIRHEAFVVMPGFRMSHRPVETEIDVACSIALANFARDDFSEADFEYLYAGPGASGKREFRAIMGRDRKIFDSASVDSMLEVYVKGVAIAAEAGRGVQPPKLEGYRIIDPRQPGLW